MSEVLTAYIDTDDEGNQLVRVDSWPETIEIDTALLLRAPRVRSIHERDYIFQNWDGTIRISADIGGSALYRILGLVSEHVLRCGKVTGP